MNSCLILFNAMSMVLLQAYEPSPKDPNEPFYWFVTVIGFAFIIYWIIKKGHQGGNNNSNVNNNQSSSQNSSNNSNNIVVNVYNDDKKSKGRKKKGKSNRSEK